MKYRLETWTDIDDGMSASDLETLRQAIEDATWDVVRNVASNKNIRVQCNETEVVL